MQNTAQLFTDHDPFVGLLVKQKDALCYVKPQMGNAGDALIVDGLRELLRAFNIRTTIDPSAADVVVWPGGSVTLWQCGIDCWLSILRSYPQAKLLIGPSTFRCGKTAWESVLRTHATRVLGAFARDRASFEVLKGAVGGQIYVGLSHDPALFLGGSDFIRQHRAVARREHVLICFRDDHEGAAKLSLLSRGISLLLPDPYRLWWEIACRRVEAGRRARRLAKSVTRARPGTAVVIQDVAKELPDVFVETVRDASEIHTDRLHVMLLGAMLGKPVYAYETSYGKLEAVFEHSLRSLEDVNIQFVGAKR
jgi:exopolysaccharide biosynthesis predicted pyruvyltransferase EpsI